MMIGLLLVITASAGAMAVMDKLPNVTDTSGFGAAQEAIAVMDKLPNVTDTSFFGPEVFCQGEYKDKKYLYFQQARNFFEAEENCMAHGGHLASVHSIEEHNFILSLIKRCNGGGVLTNTYIGLHAGLYKKFHFVWTDGTKVDFVIWNKGEPNNHNQGRETCGHISIADLGWGKGFWNDIIWDYRMTSICMVRPDCA